MAAATFAGNKTQHYANKQTVNCINFNECYTGLAIAYQKRACSVC